MSTTVKVAVACEWQFTHPDEVRAIFHAHPHGVDRNIEYDEGHHHFVVDCPVLDTQLVVEALQTIVKAYVDEQDNYDSDEGALEGERKIVPFAHREVGQSAQDHIWHLVDKLEADLANNSDQAQLIPQITLYRTGKFSKEDMKEAFPVINLADIARVSNCQVELQVDAHSNQIRIIGSLQEDVDYANLLLADAEVQFETHRQTSTFDYYECEGRTDPRMRFIRPTSYMDVQLFMPGADPLCELTMVAWDSYSRQFRTERKPPKPIDGTTQRRTLWLNPLTFAFMDERKDPAHWLKRLSPVPHGDLSLPQIGRTEQWVSQITAAPLDPNVQNGHTDQRPAVHRKTIRVLPPGAETARAPGHFNETIREESDDGSTTSFQPLQTSGPQTKSLLDTESQAWTFMIVALRRTMNNALLLHKRELSFELHIGRIYVHTVSLDSTYKPSGRGHPATVFGMGEWDSIFRVTEKAMKASTLFSPKLTQSQDDIEFFLGLKLKGGEPLFETEPERSHSFFEITCRDTKTGDSAVIELYEDGTNGVHGVSEDAGTINFHWPARTWDCSWRLSARRQAFTPDQEEAFAVFERNAYVMHDPDGINEPVLFTKRHPRVSVRSVRLIRQTVHRVKGGLVLELRQVKVLEVEAMSDEAFRASSAGDAQLAEAFNIWWEAKLLSVAMQRILGENRELELGGVAGWDPKNALAVMKQMLLRGDSIIPRIDDVGYRAHPAETEGSASRSKSQKPGQGASGDGQSNLQDQAQGRAPSAPKSQHPLIPADR